jgi:hypothetical protein
VEGQLLQNRFPVAVLVAVGHLVAAAGAVGAYGFVRDVAVTAFDAVVDAEQAYRAKSFVIERGNAERGAQLFVEFPQTFQVRGQRRKFDAVVGEQKFLVTGIPDAGELALEHDRGKNSHLIGAIRTLAEFRAATVFFHADYAAGAAHGKAKGGQAFDRFRGKLIFDIPHAEPRVMNRTSGVKAELRKSIAGLSRMGMWAARLSAKQTENPFAGVPSFVMPKRQVLNVRRLTLFRGPFQARFDGTIFKMFQVTERIRKAARDARR